MIVFVLEDDRRISRKLQRHVFLADGIIGLDSHAIVAIDVSRDILGNGEASLTPLDIGFLDGRGQDLRIDKPILVGLLAIDEIDGIKPFAKAYLRRGQADSRTNAMFLGKVS